MLTGDNEYTWLIAVVAIVVFAATLYKPTWNLVKYSPTLIHELGHALAAIITGRKISGLKVETDESGVLVSSGRPNSIGALLVTISGYPFPAFLATIMVLLAVNNLPGAALTIYHTLLIFALLLCRNIWGFISCFLAIGLTIGISMWNDPHAVSWTVIALIVFYSITGIRGSWGLVKVHYSRFNGGIPKQKRIEMKENARGSDAYNAWKQTLILPVPFWVLFFVLTNVALTILNLYLLLS